PTPRRTAPRRGTGQAARRDPSRRPHTPRPVAAQGYRAGRTASRARRAGPHGSLAAALRIRRARRGWSGTAARLARRSSCGWTDRWEERGEPSRRADLTDQLDRTDIDAELE